MKKKIIAIVIPAYKVKQQITEVVSTIPKFIDFIYVIDDYCPENSGDLVLKEINDNRVKVIKHEVNRGVGAAVISGYRAAVKDSVDIVVKIDGDGQMDPSLIIDFITPIINEKADYCKGNRFFNLETIRAMPNIRIIGNAILSFLNKLSSGYWNLFDPTNGFTAINAELINYLPLDKISQRYFFESDMLFRLNTLRAVVFDIPMNAKYEDEKSNLKIRDILFEFLFKHLINFVKRIFYNYYLRDMSLASIQLPIGILLFLFGFIFGLNKWIIASSLQVATSAGTVMLSALTILAGMQLIFAFLNYDISSIPSQPWPRKRSGK